MDENKIFEAKQRINNNVCGCRGIRMVLDDMFDKTSVWMIYALRDMQRYEIKDSFGAKHEIECFISLFEAYRAEFISILKRYDDFKVGDK